MRQIAGQPLSTREQQVVDLYVGGMRLTDIAVTMDLSIKTVSTYMRRARAKLGVTTSRELLLKKLGYK